jgi:hypothetical protein
MSSSPDIYRMRAAQSGLNVFQHELRGEQAATLARTAEKVETAMKALRAHDASGTNDPQARLALLKAAADAVWSCLVQREACGLRDRDRIIAAYGIPKDVLARLGAR